MAEPTKATDKSKDTLSTGQAQAKPYGTPQTEQHSAADPIVAYMNREQLEKSIAATRKLMQAAAKQLDFMQAAQYRDELLKMEALLESKV